MVTPKQQRSRSLAYAAVSSDQTTIATAGFDGTVRRWAVDRLRPKLPALDHGEAEVWVVAISPDNKRILTGTNDGHIVLWSEADNWSQGQEIGGKQPESVPGLAFLPDQAGGGRFAFSTDGKGNIRLWDLDAKRLVWEVPEAERHRGAVNCIVISDDGTRAATGSFDGDVGLWKVEGTGEQTKLRRDYVTYASDSAYRVCASPCPRAGNSSRPHWRTARPQCGRCRAGLTRSADSWGKRADDGGRLHPPRPAGELG